MLAMTPALLKRVVMEQTFKLLLANHNIKDKQTSKSGSSLVICATLCAQSAVCQSFVWSHGECRLLDTCQRSCNSRTVLDEGWKVYCAESKLHVYINITLFTI